VAGDERAAEATADDEDVEGSQDADVTGGRAGQTAPMAEITTRGPMPVETTG
jgi:isopentenyl phosphate kinase